MNNFPEKITKYIIDEIPPYEGLFIIQIDSENKIIDWYGPYEKYLVKAPQIGKKIGDVIPVLYGLLPPLNSPTVLKSIETMEESKADIHFICCDNSEIWIIFVNCYLDDDVIRRFLQGHNENALKKEASSPGSLSFDLPFGSIDLLDYIVFEKHNDNKYSVKGDIPVWFNDLKTEINLNHKKIELSEYFPFLEYFLIESEPVWQTFEKKRLVSVPWGENTSSGDEIYLQANALRAHGINYLLIKKMDSSFTMRQDVMQKARELKLTYERLQKAEKEMKRLLKFKDQFVSIVSHDLRSPIASVLGIANMFLEDEDLLDKFEEFHQKMLRAIKDQLHKLLDYNSKLYHWSNLELGNFKISLKKVHLLAIVENTRNIFLSNFEEKKIDFGVFIPENLEIEVDETLFGQVLNNLVGNAVKFTPEGGKIIVLGSEKKEEIFIKVKDSGVGIPDSAIDNLFTGFNRDSTLGTKGEKGSGLGLGIVKKIIEAHGFIISVESEIDKGATFIITIPRTK